MELEETFCLLSSQSPKIDKKQSRPFRKALPTKLSLKKHFRRSLKLDNLISTKHDSVQLYHSESTSSSSARNSRTPKQNQADSSVIVLSSEDEIIDSSFKDNEVENSTSSSSKNDATTEKNKRNISDEIICIEESFLDIDPNNAKNIITKEILKIHNKLTDDVNVDPIENSQKKVEDWIVRTSEEVNVISEEENSSSIDDSKDKLVDDLCYREEENKNLPLSERRPHKLLPTINTHTELKQKQTLRQKVIESAFVKASLQLSPSNISHSRPHHSVRQRLNFDKVYDETSARADETENFLDKIYGPLWRINKEIVLTPSSKQKQEVNEDLALKKKGKDGEKNFDKKRTRIKKEIGNKKEIGSRKENEIEKESKKENKNKKDNENESEKENGNEKENVNKETENKKEREIESATNNNYKKQCKRKQTKSQEEKRKISNEKSTKVTSDKAIKENCNSINWRPDLIEKYLVSDKENLAVNFVNTSSNKEEKFITPPNDKHRNTPEQYVWLDDKVTKSRPKVIEKDMNLEKKIHKEDNSLDDSPLILRKKGVAGRKKYTISSSSSESSPERLSKDSESNKIRTNIFSGIKSSSSSSLDSELKLNEINRKLYKETQVDLKRPSENIKKKNLRVFTCDTANKIYPSFLASLSGNVNYHSIKPEYRLYRDNYKKAKYDLAKKLFSYFNEKVFENQIPGDTLLEWNERMRGTAGFCYCKKITKRTGEVTRTARIVLASKILDSADRLRDTLLHEMCHAATWIVNEVSDGHGQFWKAWANKAMRKFPELPPVRRCHDYAVKTKFTYKCVSCGYSIGRHSKSLDIERKRCGYCYGKFQLYVNKNKDGTSVSTPVSNNKEVKGFALYVKENYAQVKAQCQRHGDAMRVLSQQFAALKVLDKEKT